jgi:NAD(P)-dependent dehydrogenase (short-subunit alcohol dehydrogenase family)
MTDVAPMRLDGKVVVITGAGQGLGEACAEVMAELGADLVLLDLEEERTEALAKRLGELGPDVISMRCNVADEADVQEAVAETKERFGRADALVNNAGIIGWSPLESLSLAEWDRVTNVNLRAVFLCTREFGKMMIEQQSGSIINIGSVAGTAPEPNAGAYSVTKAAAIMLARQTAVEWGRYGVRANCVSPGMMQTPMAAAFNTGESLKRRQAMTASRRIGVPREVAMTVAFLASDASSYVNGQNISVDGGLLQMILELLPRPGVDREG